MQCNFLHHIAFYQWRLKYRTSDIDEIELKSDDNSDLQSVEHNFEMKNRKRDIMKLITDKTQNFGKDKDDLP